MCHPPPLASGAPKDCGPARDNPYGVPTAWSHPDGSCQTCEQAPGALPLCSPSERAAVNRSANLKAHLNKHVSLQGTLSLGNTICTKLPSHCACNNRCAAPLLLSRQGMKEPIALTSEQESLEACPGDEGAVCCAFELSRSKRSVDVIASSTWLPPDRPPYPDEAPEPPHLAVEQLCKLK